MILLLLINSEIGICHGLAAALLLGERPICNSPAAGRERAQPPQNFRWSLLDKWTLFHRATVYHRKQSGNEDFISPTRTQKRS